VIRKGKRIYHEDAIDARTVLACGDGVADGLAGPEAERATRLAGPKARKNDF
jgi:hypothetical protein